VTHEPVPVSAPLVNPANVLTVVRIVLIPVFLGLVVISDMTSAGWRVARRFQLITSFGKVADPIADKALTGSALVALSAYGHLPWWVTGVILVREWGVTALRFWVIRYGIIPASRGGKVKTALQIAAIAWYLWPVPEPWDVIGTWLMGAALIVTVVTGFDYVVQAVRLRRRVEHD
jgi:CDP-diacylglycerol--glycerol-3-phosphate 3-phosphatidyltransferase